MVVFLKKAKELVPKKTAKFFLHQHLSGFEKARPLALVHASELTRPGGFCPRYYALHDVTGQKPKDQWLSASERMTFQIGRDQEKNIVLWFADMGRAVCHWKCVACGSVHEFCLRPEKCKVCGTRKFDPKEVRFTSTKTGASCGVDMLLALGGPRLIPHEIKTMDKDQFKALQAPLAEHKWRTNLYLRIIAESDYPFASQIETSHGYILYTTKGGYGCADPEVKKWGLSDNFSPFKEFEIERKDADTKDLAKSAKVVKDFRDGKVGMPCGICSWPTSKRAAGCAIRKACFSGDYPPEYDWKDNGK
ncbi:hypothetical protein JYP52_21295 [Nitratireductor aquibiodomus]|uniref:hypothetical protein n=1 Tax=Nitratireductor aquibiodomus TaxID=204799 RepID=UPI0019D32399|nr:hypothetical protein [Nitratireductor aquibiodomus]MBN7763677.1 hypothetical protein [Nitratireductor aquibiodomus]